MNPFFRVKKVSRHAFRRPMSENFSISLFSDVRENIKNIKTMLQSPEDLVTRLFTDKNSLHLYAVMYLDGLTDKKMIHDKVIETIQCSSPIGEEDGKVGKFSILDQLIHEVLSISEIKIATSLDEVMLALLSGDTVLFLDGFDQVLIIGSRSWQVRSIEEPLTEGAIRGPREGFTENIRTNTMLLRRRVKDPNLRFESHKIGRRSKQDLIICYIDGITHPDILNEVRRRLASVDVDVVEESGFIEQWIEDNFMSPFPQMQHTERPDKVTAGLLQGKVAIILDGSPFVLLVPVTFEGFLHSPEDFYERWAFGTLTRILRYGASFIAVFMPSLYIALVTYHPGMLPSDLAFSLAGSREGVPFPAFVEAIMMVATMELLQEAGIRLPKPIGQTVGVVGGLVIGEAAVTAGIVSPIMVIIVAITAISSFAIPSYDMAIAFRIMRFAIMFSAAAFGLLGIVLSYIMINVHLSNLKSFGVPYTTPFAPVLLKDWKDLVLRAPITMFTKRPQTNQPEDSQMARNGGKE